MARFIFVAPHAALLAAALGCAPEAADHTAPVDSTDKSMAWTAADDPALFGAEMVYTLADLPESGEARRIPWAGNYWPTWQDGYNYRWEGEGTQSTMEKYAAAFDVDGLADAASKRFGIEGHTDRTPCSADAQCDAVIGEKCALRDGAEAGHCVPTWFGVCHAWAPAAVLFDEPQRPVERNGVTFKVNDLKALATLLAEDVDVKFVSKRCDADDKAEKITYDEYGRPEASACIDTNPATWHLLLANYIGRKGQSFIEDRTFDDEVWNQPLRGYRVVSMDEIDAAEANRRVGVSPVGGIDEAKSGRLAAGEWLHRPAVAVRKGDRLTVTLTGADGDIDLFARFGSQPTARGYDCRPYLEGSNETCELVAPADGELFVSLNGYSAGEFEVRTVGGGEMPADYLFNPAAARFYAVTTDVDFIAESPAAQDGPLAESIDRYTHTDRYTYVLELDGEGRLVGGEWTGESKRNHPDFVWLPERLQVAEVMGGLMDRQDIVDLLAESVAGEAAPTMAARTVEEAGELADGEWAHFGPFAVAAGGALNATLAGGGDLDLYVRRGAQPTADDYDCRPYAGDSAETCELDGPGPIYVSVNAYAAGAFTLTVRHDVLEEAPGFAGVDREARVERGAWMRHEIEVRAGQRLVLTTEAAADVDLYLRLDAAPTAAKYDARAYTASGDERLTYTAVRSGTLHVGVHGYAAANVRLRVVEED